MKKNKKRRLLLRKAAQPARAALTRLRSGSFHQRLKRNDADRPLRSRITLEMRLGRNKVHLGENFEGSRRLTLLLSEGAALRFQSSLQHCSTDAYLCN